MSQANNVTTQHKDYKCSLPDWELVEDAAAGERAVKDKGDLYLPKPNPTDTSSVNTERFKQYLKRAMYYNATGRTLAGLVGIAFRKVPEINIPSALDTVKEDVTGSGISLIQSAQTSVSQVMLTGRAGLMVDYPETNGNVSKAEQVSGDVRPTIIYYPARAIINWRTSKRGGKTILALVVLKECHIIEDDFASKEEDQYRVLRLQDNVYRVEIWRKKINEQGGEEWYIAEPIAIPTQGNGSVWNEIPFQFIGSRDNDVGIDPAPMLDLATINIAHYRNSADYEDSVYLTGQPQPWISGLDVEWRDALMSKGILIGSRTVLPLPINGAFGIAQAQPNTLAKEAMDQKEIQMAALGARLIQAGIINKTATQQDSEDATAHSVLSLVCNNVSKAYERALIWAARFSNTDENIEFSISTEFAAAAIDAQMLTTLLATVQAGKMPESDFWTALRNAGFIDAEKSDEDIREEVSQQQPSATADALNASDPGQGDVRQGNAGQGDQNDNGDQGDAA